MSEGDFPRPVPDVGEDDIVQVLMPRRLARVFERRCLPVAAQLVGPLEFSEDDVPTFIISIDPPEPSHASFLGGVPGQDEEGRR